MAKQKPKKRTGHHAGKLPGMNYLAMRQWEKSIQAQAAEYAKDETQRVIADRQAQREGWLYIVALNEKFGFGAKRTEELEAEVAKLAAEYRQTKEANDQDYADEDLRRRVSQILGRDVRYLYEDQLPVNMDLQCDVTDGHFAALRESESRIY